MVVINNLLYVISWYRIIKVRVYMHAPKGQPARARKGVQITGGGAALKGRKITDGGASPRKGTHHHKALKGRQNLYGISVVPSALFYPMMYCRGLTPPSVVLRPFGAMVYRLFVVAIKKEHRRQSFQTFDGAKVRRIFGVIMGLKEPCSELFWFVLNCSNLL